MWRDPLEELIEELDHVTTSPLAGHDMPSFEDVVKFTGIILHGSPDAQRQLERDPHFHEFKAKLSGRTRNTG